MDRERVTTGVGRRPTPVVFNIFDIFAWCMRRTRFDGLIKPVLAHCGERRNVPTPVPFNLSTFVFPRRTGAYWTRRPMVWQRGLFPGVREFAALHPGVRTCTPPPRDADLGPLPWAGYGSAALRLAVRRGNTMAAASRQAGWDADCLHALHRRWAQNALPRVSVSSPRIPGVVDKARR